MGVDHDANAHGPVIGDDQRFEEADLLEPHVRETGGPTSGDEQFEMAGTGEHGHAAGCSVFVDHPVVPHVEAATDHCSAVVVDADLTEHRMIEREAIGHPEVDPTGGVRRPCRCLTTPRSRA